MDAVHLVHVADSVEQRLHVAADDSLRVYLLRLAQTLHQLAAGRELRHLGREQTRRDGMWVREQGRCRSIEAYEAGALDGCSCSHIF
eukprot:5408003-Pleurochrysis_carterae.AAC.1